MKVRYFNLKSTKQINFIFSFIIFVFYLVSMPNSMAGDNGLGGLRPPGSSHASIIARKNSGIRAKYQADRARYLRPVRDKPAYRLPDAKMDENKHRVFPSLEAAEKARQREIAYRKRHFPEDKSPVPIEKYNVFDDFIKVYHPDLNARRRISESLYPLVTHFPADPEVQFRLGNDPEGPIERSIYAAAEAREELAQRIMNIFDGHIPSVLEEEVLNIRMYRTKDDKYLGDVVVSFETHGHLYFTYKEAREAMRGDELWAQGYVMDGYNDIAADIYAAIRMKPFITFINKINKRE